MWLLGICESGIFNWFQRIAEHKCTVIIWREVAIFESAATDHFNLLNIIKISYKKRHEKKKRKTKTGNVYVSRNSFWSMSRQVHQYEFSYLLKRTEKKARDRMFQNTNLDVMRSANPFPIFYSYIFTSRIFFLAGAMTVHIRLTDCERRADAVGRSCVWTIAKSEIRQYSNSIHTSELCHFMFE